jgi:FMNH2-dependent dimethyl sulfone monooxygenase
VQDVRFAYWIPNTTENSDPRVPVQPVSFEHNQWLASAAEEGGFDFAIAQPRCGGAGSNQFDALTLTSALAAVTSRIGLIASIHPSLWHPHVAAKALTTINDVSKGRAAVNVITASLRENFTSYGELLDYDEHYRKAEDLLRALREHWPTEKPFADAKLRSIDGVTFSRGGSAHNHPLLFQSGNSQAARRIAAKLVDWYLLSGDKPEILSRQIEEVRTYAIEAGRDPQTIRFGVSALIIARDTENEAKADLRSVLASGEWERPGSLDIPSAQPSSTGPNGRTEALSGQSPDHFDSFKTGLIGTEDQILERIDGLSAIGIKLIVGSFVDYTRDLPAFSDRIIRSVQASRLQLPRSIDPGIRQALGLGG